MSLSSLLWLIVAVLLVLWLLGAVTAFAGNLIHLVLVLVLIIVLYNLFTGRGTRL